MTDTRLDRLFTYCTAAERAAGTPWGGGDPDPPAGVLVVVIESDTTDAFYWDSDAGPADWAPWPGAGTGTVSALDFDTDGALAANSDAKVATQKATKTYVDAVLNASDAFQLKGAIDCSANPNYPAASAGHTYRISVAGKIGGASGVTVEVGDIALCLTDATAAGNQATVGANWTVVSRVSDGDKGDITVTGGAWVIDPDAVTYDKMQNAAAGNVVLARAASTSGDYSEVALAASKLLGRGSTGDVAAINLGPGLAMSGTTLMVTAAGIVTDPKNWLGSPGYEYWLVPGNADLVTASGAANISGLDSYGWTTTSLAFTGTGTGDFNSSADVDAQRIFSDASGDTLASPQIFGGYGHMEQAAKFLGYSPTTLTAEFRGAIWTNTANETTTFMGFAVAGVTDITATGGVAGIVSDGVNFRLRSDNGNDAGAVVDGVSHTFKITVTASTTEWFIDGVSQGTITTETDVWPAAFICRAGTTNRFLLEWLRVFYS